MNRPDVGDMMKEATGVIDRTCWVQVLAELIAIDMKPFMLPGIGVVARFIEWGPCDDGWMVPVADHDLLPFSEKVAGSQFLVAVATPRG